MKVSGTQRGGPGSASGGAGKGEQIAFAAVQRKNISSQFPEVWHHPEKRKHVLMWADCRISCLHMSFSVLFFLNQYSQFFALDFCLFFSLLFFFSSFSIKKMRRKVRGMQAVFYRAIVRVAGGVLPVWLSLIHETRWKESSSLPSEMAVTPGKARLIPL